VRLDGGPDGLCRGLGQSRLLLGAQLDEPVALARQGVELLALRRTEQEWAYRYLNFYELPQPPLYLHVALTLLLQDHQVIH
jgi:hypothetical protein